MPRNILSVVNVCLLLGLAIAVSRPIQKPVEKLHAVETSSSTNSAVSNNELYCEVNEDCAHAAVALYKGEVLSGESVYARCEAHNDQHRCVGYKEPLPRGYLVGLPPAVSNPAVEKHDPPRNEDPRCGSDADCYRWLRANGTLFKKVTAIHGTAPELRCDYPTHIRFDGRKTCYVVVPGSR